MSCDICKQGHCANTGCLALRAMCEIQTLSEQQNGAGEPWVRSERQQLAWDIRRQWHAVRGKAFLEPAPKSYAEVECERAFAALGTP